MPNNETFEGYLKDIKRHWDKIVIEETDKPKDMDEDRRQCSYKNCEYIESNKGSIKRHEKKCKNRTIDERKERNRKYIKDRVKERLMYFIKTTHDVLGKNKDKQIKNKTYDVYKLGKSDNTSTGRLQQYLDNGTLRSHKDIIATKRFIGIGVKEIETELLKSLKSDRKILQRVDITSDNKHKTTKYSSDESSDEDDNFENIQPRERYSRIAKNKANININNLYTLKENEKFSKSNSPVSSQKRKKKQDRDIEYKPEIMTHEKQKKSPLIQKTKRQRDDSPKTPESLENKRKKFSPIKSASKNLKRKIRNEFDDIRESIRNSQSISPLKKKFKNANERRSAESHKNKSVFLSLSDIINRFSKLKLSEK